MNLLRPLHNPNRIEDALEHAECRNPNRIMLSMPVCPSLDEYDNQKPYQLGSERAWWRVLRIQ